MTSNEKWSVAWLFSAFISLICLMFGADTSNLVIGQLIMSKLCLMDK